MGTCGRRFRRSFSVCQIVGFSGEFVAYQELFCVITLPPAQHNHNDQPTGYEALLFAHFNIILPGGGGHSHTLPIRVCTAQRGRDFQAPDLERGIHFRGVF